MCARTLAVVSTHHTPCYICAPLRVASQRLAVKGLKVKHYRQLSLNNKWLTNQCVVSIYFHESKKEARAGNRFKNRLKINGCPRWIGQAVMR